MTDAVFTVIAKGATPFTYQWHETAIGVLIGETADTYTLTSAQASDSGNGYYCIVTDTHGQTVQSRTAALTVTAGDQYIDKVSTLCHYDDVDGTTTITDEIGLVWATVNGSQIDTAENKFGGSSLFLDGSNDYVTQGSLGDWNFLHDGTESYTVEVWINPQTTGNSRVILDTGGTATSRTGLELGIRNDGSLSTVIARGTSGTYASQISTVISLIPNGSWTHMALVYNLGTNTSELFIGGVSYGTSTLASPSASNHTDAFTLGRYRNGGTLHYKGHMDDLRITRGVTRYTGNFTPPTVPFIDVGLPYYEFMNSLAPQLWYKLNETSGSVENSGVAPNTLNANGTVLYDVGDLINESGTVEVQGTGRLFATPTNGFTSTTTMSFVFSISSANNAIGTILHLGTMTTNNAQGNYPGINSNGRYYMGYHAAAGFRTQVFSAYTRGNNVTEHVVITCDGTTFKLYVDGLLKEEVTASDILQTFGVPYITLGSRRTGSSFEDFLSAKLSHMSVHLNVLSDVEVLNIYNSSLPSVPAKVQARIDTQPLPQTIGAGGTATFTVDTTTSGGALTYQWYETTAGLLGGETSDTLAIVTVLGDTGNTYYVEITDLNGTVQSDTVLLTVEINTDDNFNNVELLLHFEGADGGTVFTDNSKNVFVPTIEGNAVTSTTFPKFGVASYNSTTTGTNKINYAANPAFVLRTGMFTIELSFRVDSAATTDGQYIVSHTGEFGVTYGNWDINIDTSGNLQFHVGSGTSSPTGSFNFVFGLITAGQYYNVAWTRDATTDYFFVDGILIGSRAAITIGNVSAPLFIGSDGSSSSRSVGGYIDEFRLTKGVARYTANYTLPTSPFPDIGPVDLDFANVTGLWRFHDTGFTDLSGEATVITPNTGSVVTNGTTGLVIPTAIGNYATNTAFSDAGLKYAIDDTDVTIELLGIVFTSLPAENYIQSRRLGVGPDGGFQILALSDGRLQFNMIADNTGYSIFALASSVTIGVSYDITITITSAKAIVMFLNGIVVASGSYSGTEITTNSQLYWGRQADGPSNDDRRGDYTLREYRWTKGVIRYTGTHTPPTTFPTS